METRAKVITIDWAKISKDEDFYRMAWNQGFARAIWFLELVEKERQDGAVNEAIAILKAWRERG
jgi:hypothetical protein